MTITTRLNIGDTAYFVRDDKIQSGTVENITLQIMYAFPASYKDTGIRPDPTQIQYHEFYVLEGISETFPFDRLSGSLDEALKGLRATYHATQESKKP